MPGGTTIGRSATCCDDLFAGCRRVLSSGGRVQDAFHLVRPVATTFQALADAAEPAFALRGLAACLELLNEDLADMLVFDPIENPSER